MVGFISLADAKRHVVADGNEEDALITSLIQVAGAFIEDITGIVCPRREGEELTFDRLGRKLILPLRPVEPASIAISYLDGAGQAQIFTGFRVLALHGYTQLVPAPGQRWPSIECVGGVVTVTATIGHAAATDDAEAACSDVLKHAARLLVGHWYSVREAINVGNITTEVPLGVEALLRAQRRIRV